LATSRWRRGEGPLIVPCNSVHTHFMSFAMDVLYVDKAQKILAIDQEMAPWRFGRIHRHARFVIELSAGTVGRTGTEVGHQSQVEVYNHEARSLPVTVVHQIGCLLALCRRLHTVNTITRTLGKHHLTLVAPCIHSGILLILEPVNFRPLERRRMGPLPGPQLGRSGALWPPADR
jgi:hypothetical protein